MEDEIAIVRALADPTHVHDRVRQQCSSAADKAQRAATVLSPVPHDGVVFADETYSCTVVTHMLTCEKLAMPSTGWTMSFDEDGFAAVLPPADGPHADDEPVVLEDAFRFQLHKAATGGLFIVGSSGSEQVDLGSLMQRWESKDLTLELGEEEVQWGTLPLAPDARRPLHLVDEEPLHRAQLPAVQWPAMALGRLWLASVAENLGPGVPLE